MIRSLKSAASGMHAQQLHIDVIAHNLANVNTTGFKRSRAEFADLLYQELRPATRSEEGTFAGSPEALEVGMGTRPTGTHRVYATGDLVSTENPLDLALEGEGFFRIMMPDGQPQFTRAGVFKLTNQGQVVTSEGRPLDPPVLIPEDAVSLTIEADGTVKVVLAEETESVELARIELSRFVNPSGLKAMGNGRFRETETSGVQIQGFPGDRGFGTVAQGMLEASNVEVVEEMIQLIAAQRAYEVNSRVIAASDEMLQRAVQIR